MIERHTYELKRCLLLNPLKTTKGVKVMKTVPSSIKVDDEGYEAEMVKSSLWSFESFHNRKWIGSSCSVGSHFPAIS